VGTFNGGSNYNIIADTVSITGTVRTFHQSTQSLIKDRMKDLCDGLTKSFQVECNLEYVTGYPCTVNSSLSSVERVASASGKIVGQGNIVVPDSVMGAEDMSFFLLQVPGCFFFFGKFTVSLGESIDFSCLYPVHLRQNHH